MNNPLLIIGNKNYSSWSLRAWLLLKAFDVDFDERSIDLLDSSTTSVLKADSPTGKVPVLIYGESNGKVTVWDTLAIAIHINNYFTNSDIWTGLNKSDNKAQTDNKNRVNSAYCQSIVAEMHSGLVGIRSDMPMNVTANIRIEPSDACLTDLARVEYILAECLKNRSSNSYLFGNFTAADAFFAPIVLRLKTYAQASEIVLNPITEQYSKTMLSNPHIQAWQQAALQENFMIEKNATG